MSDVSLSSGVSVTVSTADLESKIDAVSGKFIKTLSKSQKSLKMSIDEMGRYVNASGKVVEGLSLAQIKLGQYVDEEGKLHTANGGLVEDLNKIEQALGFYADEFGAVYNAQHEFIRLTADARKEIAANKAAAEKAAKELAVLAEKEAKEREKAERIKQAAIEKTERIENEANENAQRRAQMFGQALGSLSQLTGQFANFLATTDQTDDAVGGIKRSLAELAEIASVGIGTFQTYYSAINSLAGCFKGLNLNLVGITSASAPASAGLAGVGAAATTASVGLKAMQLACGPVGIAISLIGAGLAALATTSSSGKTQTVELSDSFKELDKRAKAAGDSIRSVADALKYGAFGGSVSEISKVEDKLKEVEGRIQDAKNRLANVSESSFGAAPYGAGAQGYREGVNQKIKSLEVERNNAIAEYNAVVAKMIDAEREAQKTEVDRLNAQKEAYEQVKERVKGSELEKKVADQITALEQKIKDATEQEAAKKLEQARKDAGIDRYLDAPKKELELTAEAYEKTRALWTQKAKELGLKQDQVDAALANYRKEIDDAAKQRKNDAARQLGVDFGGAASELDEYQKKLRNLNELLRDETINREEYESALAQMRETSLASLPGMSEFLAATKVAATAEEKHAQIVASLNEAAEKGVIDQKRRDELLNKASEQLAATLEQEAEARKAKAAADVGLDAFIAAGEKEKSAREKITEQYAAIEKAFKEGLISEEQMNKARKSRAAQLKKLEQQEKDEAKSAKEKQKQNARSRLGIDALMESLKSPLDKYRETMNEIAAAAKSRSISKEERLALENKAAEDYWKVMRDSRTSEGKSSEGKLSSSKTELASSVSSGSAELYLSQVKNQTANYQSRIQQTTENLYKASQEALYQSQQTNYYLQELLANNGNVAVWG